MRTYKIKTDFTQSTPTPIACFFRVVVPLCLLCCVLFLTSAAQNAPKYELLTELEQKADFITADKLGNLYLCDGNILYKYSTNGELLYTYSAFSKGKISGLDVSNPLKILVFSKDFMQLMFLDQKLAPIQTVSSLSDLNLYVPACICSSYDNGFWVYDEVLNQLFRYDANRKMVNKSRLLNQIWDEKVSPVGIKETESGLLAVNDTENGLLIFDRFGTYLKTIPIFANRLFFSGDRVLYVEENLLKTLEINTLQTSNYPLPESDVLQVCVESKKIIILTNEHKVRIYKVDAAGE
ncbi:MAG: hypothetical protein FWH36_05565 [Lentimicrobiaceae bacterium]|nr:hypothetical protein [Lentimicrobiaceae bacterium]